MTDWAPDRYAWFAAYQLHMLSLPKYRPRVRRRSGDELPGAGYSGAWSAGFGATYDPAISRPIEAEEPSVVPADLWPMFERTVSVSMLVLRGEHSDILAKDCVEGMQARKPDLQFEEIPRRGHAPTLNETTSRAAIDRFLDRL